MWGFRDPHETRAESECNVACKQRLNFFGELELLSARRSSLICGLRGPSLRQIFGIHSPGDCMPRKQFCTLLLASSVLSGCGTYVPSIQEFPKDAADGQMLVQAIVTNIKCEVQDAVALAYSRYPRTFMDTWGVQMTLSLAIDEKSSATPSVNWLPPSPTSAVFNLGAAATLSASATRTNKLNSFYTVQELKALGPCVTSNRPGGPMLLQSDLKLKEWLFDAMSTSSTGAVPYSRNTVSGPFKQNVISHEVKFEVVTGGSITPGWRLARATVNQSGSFLGATRTRTHNLNITFGPTDVVIVPVLVSNSVVQRQELRVPNTAAANAHLASEIGLAVANGIRSSLNQ
jgi:hypothetical protein